MTEAPAASREGEGQRDQYGTGISARTVRLLNILRSESGRCSGEELATALGVSRTTVWKHVQRLRGAGYGISGTPRSGYVMTHSPDRLYAWEWQHARQGDWGRAPAECHRLIGSTNDRAKELARAGAPEGTIVVAEEQSAGRGRRGRKWASAPGAGIWCSVVLRPALPPFVLSRLIFVASLAVAQLAEHYTSLPVGIKWPNDVLIRGRKVAGILLETESEPERMHFVVVGIGVNVNQAEADFPPELRRDATSLRLAAATGNGAREAAAVLKEAAVRVGGTAEEAWETEEDTQGSSPLADSVAPIDRNEALRVLVARLQTIYEAEKALGFSGAVERVRPYSLTLGRAVCIIEEERVWEGQALDMTPEGLLQVRDKHGKLRIVHSADVALRHQDHLAHDGWAGSRTDRATGPCSLESRGKERDT